MKSFSQITALLALVFAVLLGPVQADWIHKQRCMCGFWNGMFGSRALWESHSYQFAAQNEVLGSGLPLLKNEVRCYLESGDGSACLFSANPYGKPQSLLSVLPPARSMR